MLNSIWSIIISLLVWGLDTVQAASPLPAIVYRGDGRPPAEIRRDGGFVSRVSKSKLTPHGDIIRHVNNGPEREDGFISTTIGKDQAMKALFTSNGYIYTIVPNNLYTDVAKAFKEAGKKYGKPWEKEFSSCNDIPWSSIKNWDVVQDKVIRSASNPDFREPVRIPYPPPKWSGMCPGSALGSKIPVPKKNQ